MKMTLTLAAILAAMMTPAMAQGVSYQTAQELGTILGSEEFCAITINEDGLDAYIDARVPADDLDFADDLNGLVGLQGFQNQNMSASQKRAHCRQVKRSGKHHGLIAN